jgi:hypothetical protein
MVRWVLKKWPIKISDDRGREVTLVGPPKWQRGTEKGWWRPKYIGSHQGRRLEVELRNNASFPYALVPILLFMVAMRASKFAVPVGGWQGEVMRGGLVLAILLPFGLYNLRSHRARAKQDLVRAYLASSRCPSCDYDLSAQPKDTDGCSMCPECGAAWKMASPPADVQSTAA